MRAASAMVWPASRLDLTLAQTSIGVRIPRGIVAQSPCCVSRFILRRSGWAGWRRNGVFWQKYNTSLSVLALSALDVGLTIHASSAAGPCADCAAVTAAFTAMRGRLPFFVSFSLLSGIRPANDIPGPNHLGRMHLRGREYCLRFHADGHGVDWAVRVRTGARQEQSPLLRLQSNAMLDAKNRDILASWTRVDQEADTAARDASARRPHMVLFET